MLQMGAVKADLAHQCGNLLPPPNQITKCWKKTVKLKKKTLNAKHKKYFLLPR